MTNAAAPEPKANMGAPAPRYDARLKVTGEARFASDMAVANPANAVLVTSAIAKGRIASIELDQARAVPGVLDILTQDNTSELKPVKFGDGSATSIQKLGPEIFHSGQIVAVVIADTFEAASEAANNVKVNYDEQAPAATFGAPGLQEEDATKVSQQHKHLPQAGDAESAIAGADVTIDVEYETPTQHHNPMELFTTTCAWTGDRLTVYEPSQFVYGLKNGVAQRLGIEPEKVDVISPYVGGAFGSKGTMTPRTAMIALAAKRMNRPVKLVATRAQGFTVSTYRAETRHHIRLGASRDGKLVGYSHDGWEISSRPDPYVVAGVEDSAQLYAFGAVATKVNVVHADRGTPGFMRSPPVVPYIYALESAMDEMAVKLNIDPIEFRRVNDTMKSPVDGKPYSSRSLMTCYDQAAAAFGWKERNPTPGSMRDGEWLVGFGCATALYPTHIGPAAFVTTFCHENSHLSPLPHFSTTLFFLLSLNCDMNGIAYAPNYVDPICQKFLILQLPCTAHCISHIIHACIPRNLLCYYVLFSYFYVGRVYFVSDLYLQSNKNASEIRKNLHFCV